MYLSERDALFGLIRIIALRLGGPSFQHRFFWHFGPRPNKSLGTDPTAIADVDGFRDEIGALLPEVMPPRAEKRTLGNTDIGTSRYRGQRKNYHLVAQPDMIPNL